MLNHCNIYNFYDNKKYINCRILEKYILIVKLKYILILMIIINNNKINCDEITFISLLNDKMSDHRLNHR